MVLEICVDSLESAKAAESGGAQRIELCSALLEGGITPSAGLIGSVRDGVKIPIFVMVRPRAGDFYYTEHEFKLMKRDIIASMAYGANGVVLGVLEKNGEVDVERTRELVEIAQPLEVTFHRAIDWTPDMAEALERVIATGADRVLTSGGMPTATEGMEKLGRLVVAAGRRISVMVCGRIRKDNIAEICRTTQASEFHSSLRKKSRSPVTYSNANLSLSIGDSPIDEFARYGVREEDVRELSQALRACTTQPIV